MRSQQDSKGLEKKKLESFDFQDVCQGFKRRYSKEIESCGGVGSFGPCRVIIE